MKYGMNMLLWTTNVGEEHFPILERLKSMGYDGVEIPIFDLELEPYRKLAEKCDELGLERTAVTVCSSEANPASPDPALRKAGLEHITQVVDACAVLGAKLLCGPYHSAIGEFSGDGPTEDERKWSQETLGHAADHAQAADVMLGLEYLNRFECYLLNSAADCAEFVRAVDHPNLRMIYDTFHANIEEKHVDEAIRTCADVTCHVHISENDRSTPGAGHVEWDKTFHTLKETEYDGWMTVEAFGLALPELAAATKIWRKMYTSEDQLAEAALKFMKTNWNA
ncbi:D-tagatose 3-epimerase [Symmachiella dynata]|uniref:sugar phosphate isomerase/epimerase family protein n=1 Tax=Symmachiella dynata TaxID=2527995 RepID=UPI001188387E|nr:sugar phosphate isomerase/epimerase [Symmachiella dynata]QDT50023.1 D-tagatose 3-epimerase [Symmachiella dynata]